MNNVLYVCMECMVHMNNVLYVCMECMLHMNNVLCLYGVHAPHEQGIVFVWSAWST